MANEISVTSSLQINNGNLQYTSRPSAFRANMNGANGPVPGAVVASTSGTNVSFAPLVKPGMCRIQNLDSTNYIEWGLWDSGASKFYPLGEMFPGETYIIRLSRFLGYEQGPGTGTGTSGHGVSLRLKGVGGPCNAVVEAFET
jgi:hypothetical protein